MEKEVIVKWTIGEGHVTEVLALLPELAEKTRDETGNILYSVYQSDTNPNELILHERYTDAAAQHYHRDSEHYQTIVAGKIIPLLEAREVITVKKLF
jgi:quinol monooxygenase YgiN